MKTICTLILLTLLTGYGHAQDLKFHVKEPAIPQKAMSYSVTQKDETVTQNFVRYAGKTENMLIYGIEYFDKEGQVYSTLFYMEEEYSDFFSSFKGEGSIDFSNGYDYPLLTENGKSTRLISIDADQLKSEMQELKSRKDEYALIKIVSETYHFGCGDLHYFGCRNFKLDNYGPGDTVSFKFKTGIVECSGKKKDIKKVVYKESEKKYLVTMGSHVLKNDYSFFCYYDQDKKLIVLANGILLKEL